MSGGAVESPGGGRGTVSAVGGALGGLLAESHLAAAYQLPDLIATHAGVLGGADATAYLADLQQGVLVPFLQPAGPAIDWQPGPLSVDSTLAGRAYQHVELVVGEARGGRVQVWMPLLDGTERLGVLGVTLPADRVAEVEADPVGSWLGQFAALTAELIMAKTMYSDTIVRLRRRTEMSLAAEMQWSVLPPLTFSCREVTIAAALEPAYEVAGDTVDYAVDAGVARAAVFDGMGHGLGSAQLATLAVAAYRNARRAGRSLPETTRHISAALAEAFAGSVFSTAVLLELDTATGLLSWVNAGHPEPLLLRDGKLVRALHARPVLPLGLRISGRPATTEITVGHEQLQPDDRVLLYTDGVTEARAPNGGFFGEQALVDLLVRNFAAGLPAPETMRRVVRALLDHQQDQLADDATLLLLEWRSENVNSLTPG
jgi:serine phosphatase RsbU (regulator of sigma subunit)